MNTMSPRIRRAKVCDYSRFFVFTIFTQPKCSTVVQQRREVLKMAVGKVKRGLSLGSAIVEQYFYSGLLVGWASLVYILKEEGVYGDLCDESDVTDGVSSGGGGMARFNYVLGF